MTQTAPNILMSNRKTAPISMETLQDCKADHLYSCWDDDCWPNLLGSPSIVSFGVSFSDATWRATWTAPCCWSWPGARRPGDSARRHAALRPAGDERTREGPVSPCHAITVWDATRPWLIANTLSMRLRGGSLYRNIRFYAVLPSQNKLELSL